MSIAFSSRQDQYISVQIIASASRSRLIFFSLGLLAIRSWNICRSGHHFFLPPGTCEMHGLHCSYSQYLKPVSPKFHFFFLFFNPKFCFFNSFLKVLIFQYFYAVQRIFCLCETSNNI